MAEQTYQRVCRVIGGLAGIDPTGIGPGQSLGYEQTQNYYSCASTKPLELDSLDIWQLIMGLEDEFHISVSDAEAHDTSIDHVGGLVAFIQGKLDARGDAFGRFGVKVEGAQPMPVEYCLEHPPCVPFNSNTYERFKVHRRIFEAGFLAGSGYPSYGSLPFDGACLETEWQAFAQKEGIAP